MIYQLADYRTVTYSIPTNCEYWGNDVSCEDAETYANYQADRIRETFEGIAVRLVPETLSFNHQSKGPDELIADVDGYVEQHWIDWLAQA